jgi:dephospho-CoA kinase
MARDRLSKVEALKRIQAQIPLSCKISCADVEIDNSGSRQDETRGQVEHFVENMKRLSHCRPMLFRKLLVVFALFLFVVFSFFAVS